jgi:hypothetical protein
MPRGARQLFERTVCTVALLLPVCALLFGGPAGSGSAVISAAQSDEPVAAGAASASGGRAGAANAALSYRTSWIGNTWGYGDKRWMQIDVEAMAVTPEGDVFTNAPWDEAGGELGQYRDAQLVRHGGGSHGWGMLGGDAIAVNDKYVYAAQMIDSLGNEAAQRMNMPREGEEWFGLTRRSRADIRDGAPFEGQVRWASGNHLAFLLIARGPSHEDDAIRGLAADAARLFVSNLKENRIEIFDADSMQPLGGFQAHQPGRIAIAADGTLWVIEGIRSLRTRRVVHLTRDGGALGELALPEGAAPVDLALDGQGRLLVADNGPRQQILIFTADHAASSASGVREGGQPEPHALMHLTASLGEMGGIYAGKIGAPGPQRFNGLTGVGVDRAGNVYVSMNGAGPRGFDAGPGTFDGALIESYAPDGRRRFSLQGLLFVDGAQFVDGDPPSVYSGSKRFTLDLSRPTGEEWSYAGYTADRFHYPYDPYFHLGFGGQRGMPLVREVGGHRLLYATDMYSAFLRIYRFEPDRETAIPSGLFARSHINGAWPPNQPLQGEWIWRDASGKGNFAAASFDQNTGSTDAPPLSGWWVDSLGDVWQGTDSQGVRCFPLQGFDRLGNPIYSYAALRQYPPPAPFNRIARLNYFPADDTMFVSGQTPGHPFNSDNWNSAGSQLARYDHWKSGKPVLRYLIDLPDLGPPDWLSINGFAVAGRYIFAVESRSAIVRVFDRDSGRDLGRLKPGPEVGGTSGWTDVPMPITAQRLKSGEYLVFVEEDARGKVLMYRFTPDAGPVVAALHPSN